MFTARTLNGLAQHQPVLFTAKALKLGLKCRELDPRKHQSSQL